ncbi:MAG: hypothetical protein IJR82_00745 [Bacilli bacterium]|nr:hypothetical protein [Bacilli bacterium]
MSKDIPKVFHNTINKQLKNNKDVYYSANNNGDNIPLEKNNIKKVKNIKQKINQIFTSPNYVYKANVIIITKEQTRKEKIIGRNSKYLITMDNQTIPIDDIMDINIEQ